MEASRRPFTAAGAKSESRRPRRAPSRAASRRFASRGGATPRNPALIAELPATHRVARRSGSSGSNTRVDGVFDHAPPHRPRVLSPGSAGYLRRKWSVRRELFPFRTATRLDSTRGRAGRWALGNGDKVEDNCFPPKVSLRRQVPGQSHPSGRAGRGLVRRQAKPPGTGAFQPRASVVRGYTNTRNLQGVTVTLNGGPTWWLRARKACGTMGLGVGGLGQAGLGAAGSCGAAHFGSGLHSHFQALQAFQAFPAAGMMNEPGMAALLRPAEAGDSPGNPLPFPIPQPGHHARACRAECRTESRGFWLEAGPVGA